MSSHYESLQDTNVILRIAPPLLNDHDSIALVPQRDGTVVKLFSETPMNRNKTFNFHRVYHCFANGGNPQTEELGIHGSIMKCIRQGTSNIINCLTFGGSFTGKTFTLFGNSNNCGIAPLLLEEIYNFINSEYARQQKEGIQPLETTQYLVKLCAVEIYENTIIDLSKDEDNLVFDNDNDSVRLHGEMQVFYVEGARYVKCHTLETAKQFLRECTQRRHTGKFAVTNPVDTHSSKGHVILDVVLEKRIPEKIQDDRVSELLGQERGYEYRTEKILVRFTDTAASNEGRHATHPSQPSKEDIAIQKGITSILKCIAALGKTTVIPFRDSPLTYLLRDVFLGNSPLYVIATARPEIDSYTETAHNLKYIHRLMTHRNKTLSRPPSPVTRSRSNSTSSILSRARPTRSLSITKNQSGFSSPKTPMTPISPSTPGTPLELSPRTPNCIDSVDSTLKEENNRLKEKILQLEEQIRQMNEEKLNFVREIVMLAKNYKEKE